MMAIFFILPDLLEPYIRKSIAQETRRGRWERDIGGTDFVFLQCRTRWNTRLEFDKDQFLARSMLSTRLWPV